MDWTVHVPSDGLYRIGVRYLPLEGGNGNIQIGVLFDGTYVYEELREVYLNRWWKDNGGARVDSRGDEFAPEQTQDYRWSTKWLMDPNGVEPCLLYTSPRWESGMGHLPGTAGTLS